jgi:hypothetical protein
MNSSWALPQANPFQPRCKDFDCSVVEPREEEKWLKTGKRDQSQKKYFL